MLEWDGWDLVIDCCGAGKGGHFQEACRTSGLGLSRIGLGLFLRAKIQLAAKKTPPWDAWVAQC